MENRQVKTFDQIQEAAQYIQKNIDEKPTVGLILGSGLGVLADEIEQPTFIDYKDIPHFPVSTVEGHVGRLVIGKLHGKNILAMQGRFHFYEGYSQQEVVFPVYVMKMLGISTLIVTNAAGGMNPNFKPGDLMLIADHINFTGSNPLIGPNDQRLGMRFPDMSNAYNKELRNLAKTIAKSQNIPVQEGVYIGISGPSFETPAELIMKRKLGVDAIGMSTVPEVIAANHAGLYVLGISCITDMAIGDDLEPLTHEQVLEVANRTRPIFLQLVKGIVRELSCMLLE